MVPQTVENAVVGVTLHLVNHRVETMDGCFFILP